MAPLNPGYYKTDPKTHSKLSFIASMHIKSDKFQLLFSITLPLVWLHVCMSVCLSVRSDISTKNKNFKAEFHTIFGITKPKTGFSFSSM